MSRPDLKTVVPYSEVTSSSRGVVLVAGLQSSAATDAGIGLNGTLVNSMTVDFSSGGMVKTATAQSRYVNIPIPAAFRDGIAQRGTLQWDMKKTEFIGMTLASLMARFADAGGNIQLDITSDFTASASTTSGYRQYTNGSDGSAQYTNAHALRIGSGSVAATYVYDYLTLHDGIADEWVTVSLSWTPSRVRWDLNGIPIAEGRRKVKTTAGATIAPTALRLQEGDGTTGGWAAPMRNLVLMSEPRPNPMKRKGQPRLVMLTHSFGTTGDALSHLDNNWHFSGDVNASVKYCTLQSITPAIFKNLNRKCNIANVGYGSQNSNWFRAQIDPTFGTPHTDYASRPTKTVTISVLSNVATVTETAHNRAVGDRVSVTGATPSGLNISALIASTPSADTWTYAATAVDGAATGVILAATMVQNRVLMHKPHIVLLMGHMNDTSATTLANNVTAINTYLTGLGIVPLWVNEQNGNLASTAIDHSTGATPIISVIPTQCAADTISLGKECFYVDLSNTFGTRAAVLSKYVESNATKLHWNWPAQDIGGAAIATKVDNILANWPAYANSLKS